MGKEVTSPIHLPRTSLSIIYARLFCCRLGPFGSNSGLNSPCHCRKLPTRLTESMKTTLSKKVACSSFFHSMPPTRKLPRVVPRKMHVQKKDRLPECSEKHAKASATE